MSRRGLYLQLRSPELFHVAKRSRSVTLAVLAVETGCSVGFLSELSSGKAMRIDTARAVAIEDALRVSRGNLFHLAPADADLLLPYMPIPQSPITSVVDDIPGPLPGVAVLAA